MRGPCFHTFPRPTPHTHGTSFVDMLSTCLHKRHTRSLPAYTMPIHRDRCTACAALCVFVRTLCRWERFYEGETWRSCRTGNKAHWYCNHISNDYFDTTRAIYNGCIEPLGIFKRDDVRLGP